MDLPNQEYAPSQIKFSDNETAQIETELQRFLECKLLKGFIKQTKGSSFQTFLPDQKRGENYYFIEYM